MVSLGRILKQFFPSLSGLIEWLVLYSIGRIKWNAMNDDIATKILQNILYFYSLIEIFKGPLASLKIITFKCRDRQYLKFWLELYLIAKILALM